MTPRTSLEQALLTIVEHGASAAAESLAVLLESEVEKWATSVHMDAPFDDIAGYLIEGVGEKAAVGVIALDGGVDGLVVISLDKADAYLEPLGLTSGADMWEDVVGEVANICGARFVDGAERALLGASEPAPPAVACSSMRLLLPSILALAGAADTITFLTGRLNTVAYDARTHIHFFPGPKTIETLIGQAA